MYKKGRRITKEYLMILNTPPQVGAYRSYAPNLLHMYLIGEGPPKRIHWRRSNGEGPTEKIQRRRSHGEGLTEKVRRRKSNGEDPTEKAQRRRSIGEGSTEKVR